VIGIYAGACQLATALFRREAIEEIENDHVDSIITVDELPEEEEEEWINVLDDF